MHKLVGNDWLIRVMIVICKRLINWCHWKSRNGSVWSWFLLHQGSYLASRDLKPIVLVEVFHIRGHVYVKSFEWKFSRVFVHGHYCGLFRSDGAMIVPGMFCYCWVLQHPFLAGLPVILKSGLASFLGLTNAGLATAAGNPIHNLGPLFHWLRVLHSGQTKQIWKITCCTSCRLNLMS